jgi:tRNA (cmo5U34)-methyltransferase
LTKNDYSSAEHALAYIAKADGIPHRVEGESTLLSFVPKSCKRILDLGTGDGRLLGLLHAHCPNAQLVGLDSSATMLAAASTRFAGDQRVMIREHDLNVSLPSDIRFDAIVSSFAIHHCADSRKRSIYHEIYDLLVPGGTFCNLEHVASPSDSLHDRFLAGVNATREDEDLGNILLDVQTQLEWLDEIGYDDVDCYWKWLELALIGGVRPNRNSG